TEFENKVEVSIKDFGTGISEDDKSKLLRIDSKVSRYGTMDEKGTGLGLNITKDFIELNRGELRFESKLGQGSKFIFSLQKAKIN
ncbi:hybrid sensor histidine kinase/response regulator, partial [Candidatus Woesearchaeota archaeon]|nr:hybrid sensor histidine kinase/response regulator [Candidatus Woesearchaeota archaeon]